MFTSSHGGSLQHPTLDERFKPFLVQKDSKGGSCRKKDSMESCKTRFAPLLCSRDFFAVHVSACGACNAFSALSHVHCRRWVGIWNDPRKFGSNVVDDTKQSYPLGFASTMDAFVENNKELKESLVSRGTGDKNKQVPYGVSFTCLGWYHSDFICRPGWPTGFVLGRCGRHHLRTEGFLSSKYQWKMETFGINQLQNKYNHSVNTQSEAPEMSTQVFNTLVQNYDEGGMVHQLVKQHCSEGILTCLCPIYVIR